MGTPEQLAEVEASYTGQFLRRTLAATSHLSQAHVGRQAAEAPPGRNGANGRKPTRARRPRRQAAIGE